MASDLVPIRLRLMSTQIGVREVAVLRNLIPELADRPIAEVRGFLRPGAEICTWYRRVAEDIKAEAARSGIELAAEILDSLPTKS